MKTDRWPNLLTQFLVATTLLTRLPLPLLREDAFALGARSAWAYPLAGLIVGSLAAGCAFGLLSLSLPAVAVAGVLLGIMMITTGAMHEDGLADVFDGFWGGYTPERRLDIMKDSQIGSFGVLALLINTGLRWSAYAAVLQISLAAVVVVATQSRATMPWTMAALPNARQAGLSQSVGRPSMPIAYAAFAIGGATGIALLGWTGVATLASVAVITGLVAWIAQWKIGGQTGDVLGATQQLSETAALLTLLILM